METGSSFSPPNRIPPLRSELLKNEMSEKELLEKIEELTSLKNELKNEEQAIKLTMNSIYGAIGNNWFACFNPEVAESVTLQGQDLIKHSEKIIDRYFHDFWHKKTP